MPDAASAGAWGGGDPDGLQGPGVGGGGGGGGAPGGRGAGGAGAGGDDPGSDALTFMRNTFFPLRMALSSKENSFSRITERLSLSPV